MNIIKGSKSTLITADQNKYLKLKNVENSEELIGKPVRTIFLNDGAIPEFEEENI